MLFSRVMIFSGILYGFFVQPATAQSRSGITGGFFPGYIIKNNSDSVKGYIKIPDFESRLTQITFRERFSDPDYILNPYAIPRFGNRSGTLKWISVDVPLLAESELSFLRVLIEGKYSIYYYKILKYEHVMILDPDGNMTDVTNPAELSVNRLEGPLVTRDMFHEYLQAAFIDEPDLVSSVNKFKPRHNSIAKNLLQYYIVKGLSYKSYGVRKLKIAAGISASAMFERILFTSSPEYESTVTLSPAVGFNINLGLSNSGFSGFLESFFSFQKFHYAYESDRSPLIDYFETFADSKVSLTRLGINYTFNTGKGIDPVIEAGGSLQATITSKYNNYQDIYSTVSRTAFTYLNHDKLNSEIFLGGFTRAGINIHFARDKLFRITAGYERKWGSKDDVISSWPVSISFSKLF